MADPPNPAEQMPLDGERSDVAKSRPVSQGGWRTAFLVGAVLMACAVIPYLLPGRSYQRSSTFAAVPIRERPARLVRVQCNGVSGGGVAVCRAGGRACQTAPVGARIVGGSMVSTDADTQARLLLRPGIELTLRQGTRLVLGSNTGYPAHVDSGTLVANLSRETDFPLLLATRHGELTLGPGRAIVSVTAHWTRIEVVRGLPVVSDTSGHSERIYAPRTVVLGESGLDWVGPMARVPCGSASADEFGCEDWQPLHSVSWLASEGISECGENQPTPSFDRGQRTNRGNQPRRLSPPTTILRSADNEGFARPPPAKSSKATEGSVLWWQTSGFAKPPPPRHSPLVVAAEPQPPG